MLDPEAGVVTPIDMAADKTFRKMMSDRRKLPSRYFDRAKERFNADKPGIFGIIAFFHKNIGHQVLFSINNPALVDKAIAGNRLYMNKIGGIITLHAFVGFPYVRFSFLGDLDILSIQEIERELTFVIHDQVKMLPAELMAECCLVLAQPYELRIDFTHKYSFLNGNQ